MLSRFASWLTPLIALLLAEPGAAQQAFLPLEQAFRVEVVEATPQAVELRWNVAEGYYMYRDQLGAQAVDDGPAPGEPELPRGLVKEDPYFGPTEVYTQPFTMRVPLQNAASGPFQLQLAYQGCAEDGICYPPATTTLAVAPGAGGAAAASDSGPASQAPARAASPSSATETDRLAGMLAEASLPAVLAAFFGMGLLLTFTPCVLPMLPILSGIIVGDGARGGGRRGLLLSLAYVLPMAAAYAVLGTLAGLAGANLQASLQQPWVLGLFSAVFVALALAMFGFYRLQMPQFIQERLVSASDRQRGGGLLGVAVMGALSALIVGPCMTAPLAGALLYIGQSGSAWIGGSALFALGLGMGVPLLAVGALGARVLPKAGVWMRQVQVVFGFILLGVAVWLLERVLPGPALLAASGALLIAVAVALGALEPLPAEAGPVQRAGKGLGVLAGVWAAALILGAAAGSGDLLRPLAGLAAPAGAEGAAEPADYVPLRGQAAFQRELAAATAEGKPVVVDFYADWCVSCKIMEREVFGDPEVRQAMAGVVRLRPDVTANDADDQALQRGLHVAGPPTLMFYGADGEERRSLRAVGEIDAEDFLRRLQTLLEGRA